MYCQSIPQLQITDKRLAPRCRDTIHLQLQDSKTQLKQNIQLSPSQQDDCKTRPNTKYFIAKQVPSQKNTGKRSNNKHE